MAVMANPVWLDVAEKYKGFHEQGVNHGIQHFVDLAHTGAEGDFWCAIYVNACLEESGYRGSRSAMARSFEHDPNFTRLITPVPGCIVTRWRNSPTSGEGHVYFFLGRNADGSNRALAGNEDDQVKEYDEPADKVTGYWWPMTPLATQGTPTMPLPSDVLPSPTEATSVLFTATGKMSIFGGPDDSGSGDPLEGLAIFSSDSQMIAHGLGDYLLPTSMVPGNPGLFRRLNTEKFYIACRWVYADTPVSFLRDARVAVIAGDKSAWARAVDWGPNVRTGRVADLSPGLARALGLKTDDDVTVTIRSDAVTAGGPMQQPTTTMPVPVVPAPPPWPRPTINPDQISAMLTLGMQLLQRLNDKQTATPPPPPVPPPPTTGASPMAGLAAFLPWLITVLPQIGTALMPIVVALTSGGVMTPVPGAILGPVLGSEATPTGATASATIISTIGIGIFNWVKTKWFTPKPAATTGQP